MSFTFYFQEVLAEIRRKKLALKVSFLFSLYHHYTCNLFGHGCQCQWYRHMYCIVFFIFTFLLLEKQHKSKSRCVFHFTRFLLWDKPLKRDWQCCRSARGGRVIPSWFFLCILFFQFRPCSFRISKNKPLRWSRDLFKGTFRFT